MTKEKIPHTREFQCCGTKFPSRDEAVNHLIEKHNYTPRTSSQCRMISCVDGAGFYCNQFEWELQCDGGKTVKLMEIRSGPRGG